ncbi:hypothetical protein Tco_1182060, partial [Tanacetum coccineum]
MKQWEELIRENVFGLGGHRDRLPACLAHMLYCVVAEEQYNLAYFFVKRIECARATPTANLPYGMFLTRLYRHVMETYPHLDNGIYDIVNRVMRPLVLKQTRRPRSDRGKARHSVSSSSSHHQGTSSLQHDDDDDVETSRASTPSSTTYLNSLGSPNYQNYQIPSSSKQTDETFFTRQTTLLNQTQQMHEEMRGGFKSFGKALKGVFSKKKNAPNAPSKTPSTKDTSSSLIDYIPKSPTSSTSLSPNGYLNPPTSPPLRVSLPPPTQENASMDITLTLSPITSLDIQFDTPSPSPPILGHHIPWNLLEAHGDSSAASGGLRSNWENFDLLHLFRMDEKIGKHETEISVASFYRHQFVKHPPSICYWIYGIHSEDNVRMVPADAILQALGDEIINDQRDRM